MGAVRRPCVPSPREWKRSFAPDEAPAACLRRMGLDEPSGQAERWLRRLLLYSLVTEDADAPERGGRARPAASRSTSKDPARPPPSATG